MTDSPMYKIAAVLGGTMLIFFFFMGKAVKYKSLGGAPSANNAQPSGPSAPPPNPQPNDPTSGRPEQPKPQPPQGSSSNRPFEVDPQAKAAGPTVYLSALTPFGLVNDGPWKLGLGEKGGDGNGPILVQNKPSKYGISLHPPDVFGRPTRVSFAPGREFKWFKGWVGVNDTPAQPSGTIVFAVYGDGRKLWESTGIKRSGTTLAFEVDVTGVTELTLETHLTEGNCGYCQATWFDPWLER